MLDLASLNKEQREAVLTTDGPLLILAGAGSGKTRVLTYRIAHLILDKNEYPGSIMAITFTNKAAGEMKERIHRLIGEVTNEMWIGTFHSICMRILRRDIDKIGYKRNFVIYDSSDQQTLLRRCMKELNIDDKIYPQKWVQESISKAKNELIYPDKYLEGKEYDFRAKKVYEIYSLYQKKLMENNALDFDDIIMKTIHLFNFDGGILDYYQHKFKYIHVDEYQDTNYAQYRLIHHLSARSHNLCVVGDDDQSIYGWRGADIRNILEFEKDYSNAKIIKLEQNYRSTTSILKAANGVIRNNRGRKSKELWTEKKQGEKITIYEAMTEHEEAQFIARKILKGIDEGDSYNDYAVLYRTNAQSRVIEESFMKHQIPYKVVGGKKFYERKEIKDIIAYLRVINNPVDNVSLERIINVPKRNIGAASYEKLENYASSMGISVMEAVNTVDNIEGLSSRAVTSIKKFSKLMETYIGSVEEYSVTALIKDILDITGYVKELEDSGEVEDESRIENLQEFISVAQEFEKTSEDKSLNAFLEGIALVADIDTVDENERAVIIMTFHSAKGLEFPVVFMAGMEQGIFPHMQSFEDEEEMEEERRLCYVGMTRAMKKLYLSYAYQRTIYGRTQFNSVSDFLDEIPKDCIEGLEERTKPEVKKQTIAEKIINKMPVLTPKETKIINSGDTIKIGQKISHKKWGMGLIVAVDKKDDDFEITVAFDSQGIKRLSAKYAPIEFVG
ncbi:ATP-dependent DNA helicase PcrA [Oxobacter pfennigii]|uniref:ATP-dependent DNA helicase n=1 Tax=Oxobacter pfennigii TaxID=36849 RepID=A0A0P9AKS3_9CLOT|nr:DNA helicase PcrA [Oxobacter pfennigii]KPU45939.1 ATP-dependent DNA helicase PcrA [Oxobacter pfennigii]